MSVEAVDLIDEAKDLLAAIFRFNQDQDSLMLVGEEFAGTMKIARQLRDLLERSKTLMPR